MEKKVIAIIGGGSVFTPELVQYLAAHADAMGSFDIRLFDIDASRQRIIADFCRRLYAGDAVRITEVDTREAAIEGAAYVLIQLRQGGQEMRVKDELLGKKYRIPFVETVSVCGFSTFLRSYYELEKLAPIIQKYAPGAFVFNFSNPAGQLAETLHGLGLPKVIGVCNNWITTRSELAKATGRADESLFMHLRGLNHLTVLDAVYDMDGSELLAGLIDRLAPEEELMGFEGALLKQLGAVPNSYVRYYYYARRMVEKLLAEEQVRSQQVREINDDILEQYKTAHAIPETLKKRGGYGYSKAVINIIHAIDRNEDSTHYAVVKNEGCIPFLPRGAFIETPVKVHAEGVYPITLPAMPGFIQPLVFAVKQYEQIVIEGARRRNKAELLRGMMAHPLLGDYDIARPILDECLEMNRDYLPEIT